MAGREGRLGRGAQFVPGGLVIVERRARAPERMEDGDRREPARARSRRPWPAVMGRPPGRGGARA
ncbi:hypothetical protein BE11_34100 [Sorangium cellulosum]|nr:hypothetical protein BE11_34100 [Sorangium cellulosum]